MGGITFPISRALHTDEGEVSRAGRFCAHRRRFTAHASYRILLLLYSIANNSILFSAVHHAQHAHTVKPRRSAGRCVRCLWDRRSLERTGVWAHTRIITSLPSHTNASIE